MVSLPAFGMIILPQNLSAGNGKIPGCSCILSVVGQQWGWVPDVAESGEGRRETCAAHDSS